MVYYGDITNIYQFSESVPYRGIASFKYLVVHIDYTVIWTIHVGNVCSCIQHRPHFLHRL